VSSNNADPLPSAYSSAVLNDDPGSFWQLNDPVGSAAGEDVVANDPDDPAVASGMPTFAQPGIADGMTSVGLANGAALNVSDLMQFGDFTIEAWVKTTNDNEPIFTTSSDCSSASWYYQAGGCTGSTWSLNVVGGKLQANVPMSDGSTLQVTNNTTVADGVWHQIALEVTPVMNGSPARSQVEVQVDDEESDATSSLAAFNSGLTALQMGGSSALTPESFSGQLADVSFYPFGLDPNELYVHYLAAHSDDPVGATDTTLPTITGHNTVGSTVTADAGSWSTSGGIAPSYQYQWLRCDTNNDCQEITGATGQEYQLTQADANNTLQVQIAASTSAGTTYANSTLFAVVLAPVNTSPPTITGAAAIGNTLTAQPGSWTESGTGLSYSLDFR
jgi:hypothetical protein